MMKLKNFGLTAMLVCLMAGQSAAEDIITDPAKGGPDLAAQGEYVGKIGDEEKTFGAQVIALGDDKFRLVVYVGGLPGDGWKRGDKQIKVEGKREGGEIRFTHEGRSATIKDGKMTLVDENGNVGGVLKRIDRKSSTLGAKPPKGAVVLFDGSSADNFEGGKLSDDKKNLMAGTQSKQKFGDCSFHVEFRTPFKPKGRGQGRGNSGVYVDSRYELQVLDSFGLEGKNDECGGFYSIQVPKVNMCFPPLAWQTYDIDYTAARYQDGKKVKNARVTVKHNGFVIHDDLELPHGTPGKLGEGPDPAPIYLQGHGNPVAYRNIWVVEK